MEQRSYHAPSICPVCGDIMEITSVKCCQCGSELSGQFKPCKFCTLEEKHMQFIETFLRCRGSIKEVERSLGVSYPTVRNMMDAALNALGLNEAPAPKSPQDQERAEILEKLSKKEMDVESAIQALSKKKGGRNS